MVESKNSKVVLITGAAQRIGAVTARLLHSLGMNIVLHYRNSEQAARELQNELLQIRGDSISLLQADLAEIDKLGKVVESAASVWGRLDVLINNASSFYPTPIGSITEESWDELIIPNLKAPLFLSQAAAPLLKLQSGCIVNIVDIHAERPLKEHTVYSMAKAGLGMLTKSLARELGPEVRVNGVAPGAILWPESDHQKGELSVEMKNEIISRTALKRSGTPSDIARTIQFLIEDANYMSGQILKVDGGRTLTN
ncbi:MAG: pteridine reductase [Thiotrichales bacterium]|jgi:pteridine reductase|nr:pteridine reductase [Thiotrichales bacterium]MBT3613439.1 pteridine reductase [Thiotrichales bacterium]MBT3753334.1 pteridine reductase [Thiotrichales bacterium]MBT3837268.1 pteridine reductase [Thiotrichales bacterium]MBT4152970.1 pteridine reductase [Thiotrichales bacterium]